jgi:hypothetical protein
MGFGRKLRQSKAVIRAGLGGGNSQPARPRDDGNTIAKMLWQHGKPHEGIEPSFEAYHGDSPSLLHNALPDVPGNGQGTRMGGCRLGTCGSQTYFPEDDRFF